MEEVLFWLDDIRIRLYLDLHGGIDGDRVKLEYADVVKQVKFLELLTQLCEMGRVPLTYFYP